MKMNKILLVLCVATIGTVYADNMNSQINGVFNNNTGASAQPAPAVVASSNPFAPQPSNNQPTGKVLSGSQSPAQIQPMNMAQPPQSGAMQPILNQNVSPNAVPPMQNLSAPTTNGADPINKWDTSMKSINEIKRQTALLQAQQALDAAKGKSNNGPVMVNNLDGTKSPAEVKEITATMKSFIAFSNGKKMATILFANNSTTDVELGSDLYGYKVTNISENGVVLNKLNTKGEITNKKILLQRNIPVFNSGGTQTSGYSYQVAPPSFDGTASNPTQR